MAGQNVTIETSTIANGASLGSAVNYGLRALVGVIIPAAWTAAGLGFHVSRDGTTFIQMMAVDYSTAPAGLDEFEILAADIPTGESVFIPLDPAMFLPFTNVKPRSQTAGSAVNQGAERSVVFVFRDIGA
jgi:hypothetical protein